MKLAAVQRENATTSAYLLPVGVIPVLLSGNVPFLFFGTGGILRKAAAFGLSRDNRYNE